MNPNEQLLQAIRSRSQKATPFRYGVLTADRYVKTIEQQIGFDRCYRFMAKGNKSYDDLLKEAQNTLVYSNQEMELEQVEWDKRLGGSERPKVDLPKNTLMAFRHCLTSSRKDRDGDTLHSDGARVDPKMLLLWQHVHTLPIGKLLTVQDQNPKKLIVVSAIVDINDLCHDAAVMVDNGMARFSHGFRALNFTETKEGVGDGSGFDVKEFEIMEESLVSVPANPDAETEEVILSLVEGGKLTSPLLKEIGRGIRSHRSVRVPVGFKFRERVDGTIRELTCDSLEDLKAAKDAGLIGDKSNPQGHNQYTQGGGGVAGKVNRAREAARQAGLPKITQEVVGDYVRNANGDYGVAARTARETAQRMGPTNAHTFHHERAATFLEQLAKDKSYENESTDGQAGGREGQTSTSAKADDVAAEQEGKEETAKPEKVICKECGWAGPMPKDGKCPKCGAELGGKEEGEEKPEEKAEKPEEESTQVECPECGAEVEPDEDGNCPECGKPMEEVEKDFNPDDIKPYANEHAARQVDPGKYTKFRRQNNKFGEGVHAIWGVTKDDKVELQSIRFDAAKFDEAAAKKWLKDHKYIVDGFEKAKEKVEVPDGEKAGRVISSTNESRIRKAKEHVDDVSKATYLERGHGAQLREASVHLGEVLSTVTPVESSRSPMSYTVSSAAAHFLANAGPEERRKLMTALKAIEDVERLDYKAHQYSKLMGH